MFDRFTERAKKVMELAEQEATRLSHAAVGTEHILLGLIKEGQGVGAQAIKAAGVDPVLLAAECEQQADTEPGRPADGGRVPSAAAKKVVEMAIEEARGLGHNYVGSEHLLLALSRDEQGAAGKVLAGAGLEPDGLRRHVRSIIGRGTIPADQPTLSPEVEEILEMATEEARELGHKQVRGEHVLLALCLMRGGVAKKALADLRLSLPKIRAAINKRREQEQ